MRKITLLIQPELLEAAMKETGIQEKTAVIHYGLKEILRTAARKRLVAAGGTVRKLKAPRRRRSHEKTF